ncbi:MAG: T9SS type A sorting domain-containing protein, partial [Bacteroidales bacterium]|nr:T9SS type A sorting domain-containing protein [Bacteroidales bacterium]
GDYSSADAMLYIRLSDPQGIHFLGNSIGRDIVLTHENDGSEEFLLNAYFSPTLDSYSSGTIVFPMSGLRSGTHHLSLKVWDLHNNSSEKEIRFKVDPQAPLAITRLQNHPNPFSASTSISFQHNKPNQKLDVTVEVYDQMGNLVTQFSKNISSFGTHSSPIEWNGTASNGSRLPAGMYVYKVQIKDGEGQFFSAAQKILIVPTRE